MVNELPNPSAARPAPDGTCPRCKGAGYESYEHGGTIVCTRCNGAGDLDSFRLSGAWQQGYEAGRADAVAGMTEAMRCLERALSWLSEGATAPPPGVIRARLGG